MRRILLSAFVYTHTHTPTHTHTLTHTHLSSRCTYLCAPLICRGRVLWGLYHFQFVQVWKFGANFVFVQHCSLAMQSPDLTTHSRNSLQTLSLLRKGAGIEALCNILLSVLVGYRIGGHMSNVTRDTVYCRFVWLGRGWDMRWVWV